MADTRNPVSSANLMGHPLHPILITIPIGMFAAAFLFDILFWESGHLAFATTARWLLGFGLLGGVAAAVAGLLDFLGDKRVRNISDAWHHAIGNVILILVQIFNFLLALSLWGRRGVAGRLRAFDDCRPDHDLHRLEGRRAGVPPPRRRLRRAATLIPKVQWVKMRSQHSQGGSYANIHLFPELDGPRRQKSKRFAETLSTRQKRC
jgi:uncharacterized membrane protein